MSRRRRAFHADLRGDETVWLEEGEARHLLRVLRLGVGDAVGVFDGQGDERDGRVVEIRGRAVRVELGAFRADPVEPRRSVTLFQGLGRADRMDTAVQKATEVGAAAVRLFRTERSEGRDPGPRRLERWRRIAREACKQSGRRRVPRLAEAESTLPAPLPEVAAFILDGGAEASLVVLLGTIGAGSAVWLAVGPEGGFAREELQRARDLGWREASLGPRTLRTETAGPVAVALALAASGDL